MCLIHSIFKRYNRDIRVYKVLMYSSLCSPYFNKYYHPNTLYVVPRTDIIVGIIVNRGPHIHIHVHDGIHSYTSLRRAHKDDAIYYGARVFLAKIPKRADTIEGTDNDIVSTEIIVRPYYYVPVRIFGKVLFFIRKKYHENRHRKTE